jgi:hypothetical protein
VRCAVALALAILLHAPTAQAATRYVSSAAQFQSAVSGLRQSGGTIVLRRHLYTRTLTVGPRGTRRLWIVGTRGARVQDLVLDGTRDVGVRRLSVHPLSADGGIFAHSSTGLRFIGDRFTAIHTVHTVTLDLDHSNHILVHRNRFSHCGDRTPEWALCLLPHFASHVVVDDNWFHDCFGCDFIHGRARRSLTIENNRFARALACHQSWVKCGHSDMIELFAADGLLVRRNVFGVNQRGGAQLYLAVETDHVRVVNNLFLRRDPRAPGVVPRVGILVGTRFVLRQPQDVRIINNTVLSGRRTKSHAASSIVLSPRYVLVPRDQRPVIANTVLWRMADRRLVCRRAGVLSHDAAASGPGCRLIPVGDPALTARGQPTAASTLLIDQADPAYAPPRDLLYQRRVGPPDIGCYEYTR